MKCFLLEDYEDGAKQYIVLKLSKSNPVWLSRYNVTTHHAPSYYSWQQPLAKNARTTLKRQIITSYFPTSTTPLFLFLKISMVSRYHISKNDYRKLSQETHFRLLHHPSLLREPKASQCFPSHHSPFNIRHLRQLGELPSWEVPSCKSLWRTQVIKLKSLEIKFRSFCRKFTLSPILRSWSHSSFRSAGTRVGLGLLLMVLFRDFLPGICARTAVMSGALHVQYTLSPIFLSWAANSGGNSEKQTSEN